MLPRTARRIVLDPTTGFCANGACAARGHAGQGHIRLHSRQDKRCLCTACHQTCTTTTGTAFYRLRTSAETVTRVVTLLAHGCPLQAIVVACGFDERTVAAWGARAGRQGQAVQEHLVEPPRERGQVHADARRIKTQGGIVWMALAMLVKTRQWLAGEVRAPRDMTLICRLIERVRRCAAYRPLWWGTDGLSSYVRAMRQTVRAAAPGRHIAIAQVVKRDVQGRGVDVERRLVDGTPARVETLRRRSHGHGVINAADSERLNATFRERLASLTRRGRALVRHTLTRWHGM